MGFEREARFVLPIQCNCDAARKSPVIEKHALQGSRPTTFRLVNSCNCEGIGPSRLGGLDMTHSDQIGTTAPVSGATRGFGQVMASALQAEGGQAAAAGSDDPPTRSSRPRLGR